MGDRSEEGFITFCEDVCCIEAEANKVGKSCTNVGDCCGPGMSCCGDSCVSCNSPPPKGATEASLMHVSNDGDTPWCYSTDGDKFEDVCCIEAEANKVGKSCTNVGDCCGPGMSCCGDSCVSCNSPPPKGATEASLMHVSNDGDTP